MGVHQANRGGQYPNADTVKNLLCKIIKTGFSENEANHEGVCVESIPCHEPNAVAASYLKFNLLNATHAFYEKCFTPQDDVMYGLLSHNHLMLGLKCIQNGANWRLGDEWRSKVHVDGAWNCKAVEAVDAEIANVLKNGLRMEVLSWQIHTEEPTACSLISQALNKAQSMALKTSELTAMAVLTGAVTRAKETAVADEVAYESCKEALRGELDSYVDMPGFVDLFEFVVNMGASDGIFIPELLDFATKFVDSKKKQLSLAAFAVVNKIPNNLSHVKMALVMRAYRLKANRTWCPVPEHCLKDRAKNGDLDKC